MKKIFAYILFTTLGLIIGVAVVVTTYYIKNKTTEVWTSTADLYGENGLLIPRGTEFIHHHWMSEGFATLRLYLNVEGSTLDTFTTKQEPKYNLVIPYSVTEK